ncbi:MAG: BamA/TamA family outer membrane protein [Candidatus Eisenbacteria bacterium]|uniref:BamA/TamA family outer membrane protein n=1 Tax=Eiseniibacteriota bacterium TaxID=2212470 RepID=A0A7Y2EC79_UNCEI|nr:BamA/TamA family outer membrane protein [Candidatus Eisenbacteria bacterium]
MRRVILVIGATLLVLCGCGRSGGSLLLLEDLPDVESIEIEGNEAFDDGTLEGLMTLKEPAFFKRPFKKSRYSERVLKSDLQAIRTFYYRNGYIRATIENHQVRTRDGKVHITIQLTEGVPFFTAAIVLTSPEDPGLKSWQEKKLNPKRLQRDFGLKVGKPFDPFSLTDDRRTLTRALEDRGYLLAKVTPRVEFDGTRALVFFSVLPGVTFTVDEVDVVNNKAVPTRYLLNEVELRSGDLYQRNKILESQQQLLQTGYFNDVAWDTTGVDRQASQVDLSFTVSERQMYWVEGGVGVSSENRVRLTGGWGSRSFLRTGTRFALTTETELDLDRGVGSYIDDHQSQILLRQSRLAGSRWEGQPSLTFNHDREPDYRQNIYGAGLSFRRRLSGLRDQIVLGIENRWVDNDSEASAIERDPQLSRETYQTRSLTGRIQLDSRNDFFEPNKGSYREVSIEVAGGALGGNNGFRKATGTLTKFVPMVPGRAVLAWRLQVGSIDATNAKTTFTGDPVESEVQLVPIEDRYLLGGANTVRGFDQNELDGRRTSVGEEETEEGGIVSLLGNLETRVALFSRLSLVGFLDAGNVWQDDSELALRGLIPRSNSSDVSPSDLRYSFGAGLRVATPVGPVRVDYARKWNVPELLMEAKKDTWHVSLGHTF